MGLIAWAARRAIRFARSSRPTQHDGGLWYALGNCPTAPLVLLRKSKFRRARPRLSRVQEMAAALDVTSDERKAYAASDYETAIRAVCEWLRSQPSRERPESAIEREFLEPR